MKMRKFSAERSSVAIPTVTRSATRVTVSAFGALAGLAGIEHGIGEILQGNVAPDGGMILSWPDSEVFRILSGEPAMTLVSNLLVTGVLAIIVSLVFFVWAIVFVERKHGGLVLILLSAVMLLVGGGFGPPILGVILGLAATRMNEPLRRRAYLPVGSRILARLWPWFFAAAVIAWLSLLPGTVLLDFYFGVGDLDIIVPVIAFIVLSAFGSLLLTIFAALARDVRLRTGLHRASLKGG